MTDERRDLAHRNSPKATGFISNRGMIKVDFQVNGETYFLSLAENERHWEVFVSTETGARPVPVYEDAPEFRDLTIVVEEDKGRRRLPN